MAGGAAAVGAAAAGAMSATAAGAMGATAAGATAAAAAAPSPAASPLPEVQLDACGLSCPGPILALRRALPALAPGQSLRVTASDPGFARDFPAFCDAAGVQMLSVERGGGVVTGVLRQPAPLAFSPQTASAPAAAPAVVPASASAPAQNQQDVAIVVFSGELDKVLAALVIANGAVAMGGRVTLFFTFYGLSALRAAPGAPHKFAPHGGEASAHAGPLSMQDRAMSFVDTAMGAMLPRGPAGLHLSHLDFGGLGAKAMAAVMAAKHLPNLPDLLREAHASGRVRFVACAMSMNALGVREEDLSPDVELGGVADFLAAASKAKTTLFI